MKWGDVLIHCANLIDEKTKELNKIKRELNRLNGAKKFFQKQSESGLTWEQWMDSLKYRGPGGQ